MNQLAQPQQHLPLNEPNTEHDLEELIATNNPELVEAHNGSELDVFPTLKDRVNVLTRLKLLGIKTVEVSFSGGGDSGEIEGVDALNHQGERVPLHEEIIAGWVQKQDFDSENHKWIYRLERMDMPLDELLKDICNNALDRSGHDWYNNDGGQGCLNIDLTQSPPLIELQVSVNYTTTDDHSYNI